jgi:superfamily I DNA and/or RNA helicase
MTEPGMNNIIHNLTAHLIAATEEEVVANRNLHASYSLGAGRRTVSATHRALYHFSLANPPRVQEESRAILRIGGRDVDCVVLSRRSDGLDIATFTDLGDEITSATLVINKSEILEVLLARLKGISHDASFNSALAQELFSSTGRGSLLGEGVSVSSAEDLTSDQKEAVRSALSRKVTLLWGPPGTGKTVTLAAIAWELFRESRRVLILSHTNHAVDGVVEGLCKRIVGKARMHLPEGTIVRLGTIARRSLASAFGDQISVEALAAAREAKGRERADVVRKEVSATDRALAEIAEKVHAAERLASLESELSGIQEMYAKAKLSEGSLQTILRVLRIRYGTQADGTSIVELERSIKRISSEILAFTEILDGSSAEEVRDEYAHLHERKSNLLEAIQDLESPHGDLAESVIDHARVVACTASQAVLRFGSLKDFDVVLMDEGSMLPLPFVYLLSGLAKESVVVGGDFRQLPPISLSSAPAAREWFARDIFEVSGIVDAVEEEDGDPRLVALTSHFRGHETLCQLINDRFYGGRLTIKNSQPPPWNGSEAPLGLAEHSVLLVDTSSLAPRGHLVNSSKGNIVHALVVRNIVAALRRAGMVEHPGDLGVIAPYRPQVALIEDLLHESSLDSVTVGTAHRFQGGERRSIIFDLTESSPHSVGTFLGPRSLRDVGAKLLNVSLSRAQHKFIVVANLDYLNRQLSSAHLLRGVIDDITRLGSTIDALELFTEGLVVTPGDSQAVDGVDVPVQRFNHESFLAGLVADIGAAQQRIVIGSSDVSSRSAHVLATVLRPVIARGVHGAAFIQADGVIEEALSVLRSAGIDNRPPLVGQPDFVQIDDETLWIGSIPPLASVEPVEGTMLRVVGRSVVSEFLRAHESVSKGAAESLAVGNY